MTNQFLVGLLTGLAAGWLIEWIIDRVYWRNRVQRITSQLEDMKDKLREIKGVDKKLEKRLNVAGIFSFRALSMLSKKELDLIAGDAMKQVKGEYLIRQAEKLAEKKKKKK